MLTAASDVRAVSHSTDVETGGRAGGGKEPAPGRSWVRVRGRSGPCPRLVFSTVFAILWKRSEPALITDWAENTCADTFETRLSVFRAAVLRCNLHLVQPTHSKCTVSLLSVNSCR